MACAKRRRRLGGSCSAAGLGAHGSALGGGRRGIVLAACGPAIARQAELFEHQRLVELAGERFVLLEVTERVVHGRVQVLRARIVSVVDTSVLNPDVQGAVVDVRSLMGLDEVFRPVAFAADRDQVIGVQ
jgi:hypothetical protein